MPNIEEFEAGSGKIDVSDRGAEAYAQAGRRAGVAFHELGATAGNLVGLYQQHQTDADVSNTYKSMSDAKMNGLDSWNKVLSAPGAMDHPELGKAFLDQYNQAVDEIAGHATTEQGKNIAMRLAAQRKEEMFDRVSGDMGHLAVAKLDADEDAFLGNTRAAVIDDPSPENLAKALGEYRELVENATTSGLTGEGRAQLLEKHMQPGLESITLSAYKSLLDKGESQLAAGRPGTALDAVQKMIDGKVAWENLGGTVAASLQGELDTARERGAERFQQAQRFGQDQAKTAGAGAYAQIDAELEPYKTNGKQPPPELAEKISQFTSQYGSVMPGESKDLNSLWATVTDPSRDFERQGGDIAKASALETRILTGGGTKPVDVAELNGALANGDISIEQYKTMKGLLPANGAENPQLKQAMSELSRQETALIGSLPQGRNRGVVAQIMIHDMTAAFQGWLASGQDPDKALDIVTNHNNPRSFVQLFPDYLKAMNQSDPAGYLRGRLAGLASAGYGPAQGSAVNPVYPTRDAPAPAQPTKVDQGSVDKIFGVN